MFALTMLLAANSTNCGQLSAIRITSKSVNYFWVDASNVGYREAFLATKQIYIFHHSDQNDQMHHSDLTVEQDDYLHNQVMHQNDQSEVLVKHTHLRSKKKIQSILLADILDGFICSAKQDIPIFTSQTRQEISDAFKTFKKQKKHIVISNIPEYNAENSFPSIKQYTDHIAATKSNNAATLLLLGSIAAISALGMWSRRTCKNKNHQRHMQQKYHSSHPEAKQGHQQQPPKHNVKNRGFTGR